MYFFVLVKSGRAARRQTIWTAIGTFLGSAPAHSQPIGSQRSQGSRPEIFRSFGPFVQATVSDGLDLPRLPERSTLQRHPQTNFSLTERGKRSALSAPYGSWMPISMRSPIHKHCVQSRPSKRRTIEKKSSSPVLLLQVRV